jgi:hypothetical protein
MMLSRIQARGKPRVKTSELYPGGGKASKRDSEPIGDLKRHDECNGEIDCSDPKRN